MKKYLILSLFILFAAALRAQISFEPFVETKYSEDLYIKEIKKTQTELIISFKYRAKSKSAMNIFPPKNKDAFVLTNTSGNKLSDLTKISGIIHNKTKLSDLTEYSQPLKIEYGYNDSIFFTLHFPNPNLNIISVIEGYANFNDKSGQFWHFLNVHLDKSINEYIKDNNPIAIGCKAYNYIAEMDYYNAVETFKKCASENGQCSYQIGFIYQYFLTKNSNKEEIKKYYEQAVAQNYSRAYLSLAYLYNEFALEQKTEQDFIRFEKLSYDYALKALQNGYDEAYYPLSNIYTKGVVVTQNFIKAKEYLNILAQKNWNIKTQSEQLEKYIELDKLCKLGKKNAIIEFYEYNFQESLENPFKHIKYLKTIANNTNPKALYYLSSIYKNLNNVEESKKYAKQFVASAITFEDPRSIDPSWSAQSASYLLMPYALYDECIKYYTAIINGELASNPSKVEDIKKRDLNNGKIQLYWLSPKGSKIIDTVAIDEVDDLSWYIADPFILSLYHEIRGDAYKAKGLFNEAIKDYLQYQEYNSKESIFNNQDGDGYRKIAMIYNLQGDNINTEKFVSQYLSAENLHATQYNHVYGNGERIEVGELGNDYHGKYRYYYKSGKLYAEGSFFLDEKNGKKTFFREDGSIIRIENYLNGLEHGEWIEYYSNGSKESEKKYDKGKPLGTWKEYSIEANKITKEQIYTNGTLTSEKSYNYDGNIQSIKTLISENLYDIKNYWSGGKIISITGKELNAKRIDKWTYYHSNGKVSANLTYDKQGNSIGEHIWYYDNGTVKEKNIYSSDGLSYKTLTYYPNGKNKSVGEYKTLTPYKNYERNGLWKGYYVNGNVMFEGNFSMGIGKMQRHKDPSEESYWKPYVNDKTIAWGYAMLDLEKAKGFFSDNEPYEILDKIVSDVKSKITLKSSYTKTEAVEIMNAIGSTLKSMGYVYDDKHVDYYHSCLRNKAMDCDIFACTYVTVADKFGLPVNLVYGPGHAFVKWNSTDVNFYWECTNHSETSFSDYKNWLLFKEYQVSSGAFMRPMDRQEQIGHAYFLLASNAYYDEAINYLLTAISLSEKNIFAYLFIAHKFSKDEKYPYLEKATNLLQSDFFLASELADYYEYSDYSKSILFYLKSIDEFENYMSSYGKNEYKVKYYNNIYSLYYLFKKTNDTKNAIEWGERYIRENPSNEYRIESIKKDIYELKNPKK